MTETTTKDARSNSLEFWAQTKPDQVALVEGERSLTWSEWNRLSDHLAESMARAGVGRDDIIAVRTQIRIEWGIINCAIAKLGGSVLGLNWRLTPSEVAYVLGNSGAVGLMADDPDPRPMFEAAKPMNLKFTVSIDTELDGYPKWGKLLATASPERFSAAEAGLVIYTSGTTGLPKGVPPRNPEPHMMQKFLEYRASMAEAAGRRENEVILCTMPFSHGAGPSIVRGGIARGCPMVMQRRFDPEGALKLIQEHKITSWTGVPTMIKRVAGLPEAVLKSYDVSSLKHISVGAAPVPFSLKLWIMEYFGEDSLHEAYGSTETSMISHMPPSMQRKKPGSSGLPYKHVDVSVRDSDGKELPRGKAGELWIRTPLVIKNYLNADPLDEKTLDADGFFRVGDVGYVDEDGYIFITDRAKDMIISGGVNLYPAEIEAGLLLHPAVQDVAVIGIPDDEFGEQVKAFVEVKPGRSVTPNELLEFSKESLASYKRPKSIEIVAELPRNEAGKLLKKDLRARYWEGRERMV
jgi:long-chain acyl-CoA synthetase